MQGKARQRNLFGNQITGVRVRGANSNGSDQVQDEAQIKQAMVSRAFHPVFWYINKKPRECADAKDESFLERVLRICCSESILGGKNL
jgi:hypothetical protein